MGYSNSSKLGSVELQRGRINWVRRALTHITAVDTYRKSTRFPGHHLLQEQSWVAPMRGHWTSTVVQVTGCTKACIWALLFHEPGHLLQLRWQAKHKAMNDTGQVELSPPWTFFIGQLLKILKAKLWWNKKYSCPRMNLFLSSAVFHSKSAHTYVALPLRFP